MVLYPVYFLTVCFMLVSSFPDFESNQGLIETPKFKNAKFSNNLDLIKYLESLDGVINFYSRHKNDIDINFYFGLFLANVNLKRAVQEKHQVLPEELRIYLKGIIRESEKLVNFFRHMIRYDDDQQNNKYIIFSLFSNGSIWIDRLRKFHLSPVNELTLHSDLDKVYTNWTLYTKNINDVNEWVPNPQESDKCLISLALAKEIRDGTSRRCRVSKSCYEMLQNGTDFGYALAHRLFFLQQARYGRGCSIFSEQKDIHMSQRFCSIAYQEAVYIAKHGFAIVDLLLEYVCLCALDGHAQFLRRFWLEKILRFQTVPGCFSQYAPETLKMSKFPTSTVWKIINPRNHDILGGYCNGHTTALAASTLAMASRFIIESYY